MKALKNTEKYEIDGQILDCSLAKPQADQNSSGSPNSQTSVLPPTFPPLLGYGLVGGAYGALGTGQPMIYGRGPTLSGMATMPMLLLDGRIGYVLEPGMHPHTPPTQPRGGRGGGAGRSSSGRHSSESSRGRSRCNPY